MIRRFISSIKLKFKSNKNSTLDIIHKFCENYNYSLYETTDFYNNTIIILTSNEKSIYLNLLKGEFLINSYNNKVCIDRIMGRNKNFENIFNKVVKNLI